MRCGLILIALILLSPLVSSEEIYVPDDHGTIQEALHAALDGDTVIVRPGTYTENIDFMGKAVTLASECGVDLTVIDGGRAGSVVLFSSGEKPDSIIEGFSLINGSGTLDNSNLLGGGICCRNGSSPTIRSNRITDNKALFGGGIACNDSSSPLIAGNTIARNIADEAVGYGGGIACMYGSSPTIKGNVIAGNLAGYFGGGVYSSLGTPLLTDNIIAGNRAKSSSWGFGGGIFLVGDDLSLNMIGNTIADNSAARKGGGIFCWYGISLTAKNTIVHGNDAAHGTQIYLGAHFDDMPCSLAISHSDVEGGEGEVYLEPNCTLDWDAGSMIDADPLFVAREEDDFHITFDSPCRSAGDRNAPGLSDLDFEGDPRTGLFAFPDMGADEFHTHFYVNGSVANGNDATAVVIGWPGTNPVMVITGSGVRATPDSTPFGNFWLMPPWDHRVHFNPIPDNGARIIERVVATGLPAGTQIPIQALVGTELSNLCVVTIE